MKISIHAPAWGATPGVSSLVVSSAYFNPRSRVGSDAYYSFLYEIHQEFQSTLPRGERHHFLLSYLCPSAISIHAPAWGATQRLRFHRLRLSLFQSTLPRGERLEHRVSKSIVFPFQSTLPRGERQLVIVVIVFIMEISIHAPAWGATYRILRERFKRQFQSTLPRGERPIIIWQ